MLQFQNDKRYTFVKKAITYGRQYPKVVPSYLDFNELEKDLALYDDLMDVIRALKPFMEMLEDTGITVSGESYRGALAIYHNAEQGRHHDLQGADTIYEDLRKLFPRTGPAVAPEDDGPLSDERMDSEDNAPNGTEETPPDGEA